MEDTNMKYIYIMKEISDIPMNFLESVQKASPMRFEEESQKENHARSATWLSTSKSADLILRRSRKPKILRREAESKSDQGSKIVLRQELVDEQLPYQGTQSDINDLISRVNKLEILISKDSHNNYISKRRGEGELFENSHTKTGISCSNSSSRLSTASRNTRHNHSFDRNKLEGVGFDKAKTLVRDVNYSVALDNSFLSSLQDEKRNIERLLDNSSDNKSALYNVFARVILEHQHTATVYSLFCIHSQAECLFISSLLSQIYGLDSIIIPLHLAKTALNIPRTERRKILGHLIDNELNTDAVATTYFGQAFEGHLRNHVSQAFALSKAMDAADNKSLLCLQGNSRDRLSRFHETFMSPTLLASWCKASEGERADFLIKYIERSCKNGSQEYLLEACINCLNEQIRYFDISSNGLSSSSSIPEMASSRRSLLRSMLDGRSENAFQALNKKVSHGAIPSYDTTDTCISQSNGQLRKGKTARVAAVTKYNYTLENSKVSTIFSKEDSEPHLNAINNKQEAEAKYPENVCTVKQTVRTSSIPMPILPTTFDLGAFRLDEFHTTRSASVREPEMEQPMILTLKPKYIEGNKSVYSEEEEEKSCGDGVGIHLDEGHHEQECLSVSAIDYRENEEENSCSEADQFDEYKQRSVCSSFSSVHGQSEEEAKMSEGNSQNLKGVAARVPSTPIIDTYIQKVEAETRKAKETKLKETENETLKCNNKGNIKLDTGTRKPIYERTSTLFGSSFDEKLNAEIMRSLVARSFTKKEPVPGCFSGGNYKHVSQLEDTIKHVVMIRPKIKATRHKMKRQRTNKAKVRTSQVVEAYLVDKITGIKQPLIAYKI